MSDRGPTFLERRSYRTRRLIEMSRLIPVVACFGFFLPLLWGEGTTRRGLIYLFSVWALAIFVCAPVATVLTRRRKEDAGSEGDADGL